jgi:DNA-binding MarR family transcriptional regulator
MSQLIQRFERRGLARRAVDPSDGRAALVTVTGAGRELLRQRRRDIRTKLADLLATLDNGDRAGLELSARVALPLLDRLIDVDAALTERQANV